MTDRTFIIGDVHGMSDALDRLVVELQPKTGDRFMFLGDLVDKGPDTLGVLVRVRRLLAEFPGSLSICGNHEDGAIALKRKAEKAGSWTGLRKAETEKWLTQATEEDYTFLKSLPLWARPFPDKTVLLVHGGLFPSYFSHYPGLPEPMGDWHRSGGKQWDRARRFLRIRHVHKTTGEMVTFGSESADSQPWAEWYDGREGLVFYGHDPQRSGFPHVTPHAVGVDTGAVFGGSLTAVVAVRDPDLRTGDVVSIKTEPYAKWLDTGEE